MGDTCQHSSRHGCMHGYCCCCCCGQQSPACVCCSQSRECAVQHSTCAMLCWLQVACWPSPRRRTRSQLRSKSSRLMATTSSYALQRPLYTCAVCARQLLLALLEGVSWLIRLHTPQGWDVLCAATTAEQQLSMRTKAVPVPPCSPLHMPPFPQTPAAHTGLRPQATPCMTR